MSNTKNTNNFSIRKYLELSVWVITNVAKGPTVEWYVYLLDNGHLVTWKIDSKISLNGYFLKKSIYDHLIHCITLKRGSSITVDWHISLYIYEGMHCN